ncbi:MAG TPA: flagellar assembly protein FliW [Clostridiaceae bacterium]|nr:flagellar assembly protein FliW [Clostridiaceae bacterium]
MLLKTRHFGEIEIDENKIIRFDGGLPGFNNVRQFIILETEPDEGLDNKSSGGLDNKPDAEPHTTESSEERNSGSPFKWLQCVDDPMLAFAIANPFLLKPDYDVKLSDEVVEHLEIKKEVDVAIYTIVVVPEDITKMTMNLKAPLVINVRNKKGVQAILDTEEYSIRHHIMSSISNKAVDNTVNEAAGQEV